MTRFYSVAGVLAFAAALPASAIAQQTPPGGTAARYVMPARDTALWTDIGNHARARATELNVSRPADNARAVAQYLEAIGLLERGRYDSAQTMLQAVMIRVPNNPLYVGDFAYAQARDGAFEEAGNSYTRAFQLQQQNAWFIVGIAAARAGHRQWVDAAGTIQLAAQTDSAVVDAPVATTAVTWFEQAGDRTNALIWARLAVARNPDEPMTWLRIATYLRARQDSTPEGIAAIRRFRTMRPDDKLGAALYADYLYEAGQRDSALALMTFAAQDTAYREFAAQLYLQVGRDYVQRRDFDNAIRLLTEGRPWANATQQPIYANILGRAQLMKVNNTLEGLSENRACAPARAVDSLMIEVERNLRDGLSFDSARTASFLESIVPGVKQNTATAVRNCRDTPPAPARQPTRAPARPAPRRP